MAVELRRPDNVRVAFALVRRRPRRRPAVASALVSIAARGLLVGFGLGIILIAGPQPSLATVTTAGVAALAVALLAWDR
jgi:hypothetical protein